MENLHCFMSHNDKHERGAADAAPYEQNKTAERLM